jgi:hydroxymethylpyrimidine/phosphomethylpyrimidine kinase
MSRDRLQRAATVRERLNGHRDREHASFIEQDRSLTDFDELSRVVAARQSAAFVPSSLRPFVPFVPFLPLRYHPRMRVALTIAGSDSSGGAGIQADLKTFTTLGVFGMSALTAITAQNTTGVAAAFGLPVELIARQIDFTVADIRPHAVKTGMLATIPVIECVADAIARNRLTPLVCDPVMTAKSGARLIDDDAIDTLRGRLVPLATVLTPNRFELAMLSGRDAAEIIDERSAIDAARTLLELGVQAVAAKAIPLAGRKLDLLITREGVARMESPALADGRNHGSGCAFAAAIAARLALGDAIEPAARFANAFVHRAIEAAPSLGSGIHPVNVLAGAHPGQPQIPQKSQMKTG